MGWSYSSDMSTPLNYVRLKIGDTDESEQQLQDEEIEAILLLCPNKLIAASNCAKAIASKLAKRYKKTLGPMTTEDNELYYKFVNLSKELLLEAKGSSTFAGAIQQSHVAIFDVGVHGDADHRR